MNLLTAPSRPGHLAIALTALLVAGCAGASDYAVPLPNGYRLVRAFSGSLGVVAPTGRVIVGPSRYGVVVQVMGDLVVGNMDTEEEAYKAPSVPDRYFVVDTRSGVVARDMSFAAYRRTLAKHGVVESPRLVRPDRSTRFGIPPKSQ